MDNAIVAVPLPQEAKHEKDIERSVSINFQSEKGFVSGTIRNTGLETPSSEETKSMTRYPAPRPSELSPTNDFSSLSDYSPEQAKPKKTVSLDAPHSDRIGTSGRLVTVTADVHHEDFRPVAWSSTENLPSDHDYRVLPATSSISTCCYQPDCTRSCCCVNGIKPHSIPPSLKSSSDGISSDASTQSTIHPSQWRSLPVRDSYNKRTPQESDSSSSEINYDAPIRDWSSKGSLSRSSAQGRTEIPDRDQASSKGPPMSSRPAEIGRLGPSGGRPSTRKYSEAMPPQSESSTTTPLSDQSLPSKTSMEQPSSREFGESEIAESTSKPSQGLTKTPSGVEYPTSRHGFPHLEDGTARQIEDRSHLPGKQFHRPHSKSDEGGRPVHLSRHSLPSRASEGSKTVASKDQSPEDGRSDPSRKKSFRPPSREDGGRPMQSSKPPQPIRSTDEEVVPSNGQPALYEPSEDSRLDQIKTQPFQPAKRFPDETRPDQSSKLSLPSRTGVGGRPTIEPFEQYGSEGGRLVPSREHSTKQPTESLGKERQVQPSKHSIISRTEEEMPVSPSRQSQQDEYLEDDRVGPLREKSLRQPTQSVEGRPVQQSKQPLGRTHEDALVSTRGSTVVSDFPIDRRSDPMKQSLRQPAKYDAGGRPLLDKYPKSNRLDPLSEHSSKSLSESDEVSDGSILGSSGTSDPSGSSDDSSRTKARQRGGKPKILLPIEDKIIREENWPQQTAVHIGPTTKNEQSHPGHSSEDHKCISPARDDVMMKWLKEQLELTELKLKVILAFRDLIEESTKGAKMI